MSKFVCENPDCENFQKVEEYTTNIYKMIDGHLVSNNAPCPKCGKMRKEINDNVNIPIGQKNIGLLKFTMASSEDRREILKKRSHEHFEKEIKPLKQQQLNSVMSEFKQSK